MTGLHEHFPGPHGRIELWFRDADGNELLYVNVPNLVVNTGRSLMAAAAQEFITHVAVGTNGTYATPADTLPLADQFVKPIASITSPTNNSVMVTFQLAVGDFNGNQIREFALLNVDGSTQTMFNRKAFGTGWTKTSDIQVQGTWTITF